MTKTNDEMRLSVLISEIDRNAEAIKQYPESSINQAATDIQIAAHKIEVSFISLRMLLWMSIAFLLLAVTVAITLYNSNNRIKVLNEQLIESAKQTDFDSLKNKILLDESGSTIKYTTDKNGLPVAYMTLVKENQQLKDSLSNSQLLLNFAKETYELKFSSKQSGSNIVYSVTSGKIDKLLSDIDEANNILKTKTMTKDTAK